MHQCDSIEMVKPFLSRYNVAMSKSNCHFQLQFWISLKFVDVFLVLIKYFFYVNFNAENTIYFFSIQENSFSSLISNILCDLVSLLGFILMNERTSAISNGYRKLSIDQSIRSNQILLRTTLIIRNLEYIESDSLERMHSTIQTNHSYLSNVNVCFGFC